MDQSKKAGYLDSVWHWKTPRKGVLLDLILERWPLSEARLLELIELGSIYCEQKRQLDPDFYRREHPAETYLRIHSEPRRVSLPALDWSSRVLYQDAHYLCIDKPGGVPSHPMVDNWPENALTQCQRNFGALFLTHRLDRATEGLLLFAKNPEAQAQFNRQLREGKVQKHYWAETEKGLDLPAGHLLRHWMVASPRTPKRVLGQSEAEDWREGPLDLCELEIVESEGKRLRIRLITGRTHQIRAQLSAAGSPIANDRDYGAQEIDPGDRIHLQSHRLEFRCAITGVDISVEASAATWRRPPA